MADTIFFDLDDESWTEISTGGPNGFITAGNRVITYLESDSIPSNANVAGHQLTSRDFVRYTIAGIFKVYARSTQGNTSITVTPD